MPDLRAHLGECRFYNCTHLHEPGCAVRSQVQTADTESTGSIAANRYRIYQELFAELSSKRTY